MIREVKLHLITMVKRCSTCDTLVSRGNIPQGLTDAISFCGQNLFERATQNPRTTELVIIRTISKGKRYSCIN